MHNCLIKKHVLHTPYKKEKIIDSICKESMLFPPIRFNFFWHCTPYTLYLEVTDCDFHLSANSFMFSSFVPIIHGKIIELSENESTIEYRILPNNAIIIIDSIMLFIQVLRFCLYNELSLLWIIKNLAFIVLFFVFSLLLTWFSSFTPIELFMKAITMSSVD